MQSDEDSFGWTETDEESSSKECDVTPSNMKEKLVKVKLEKDSNDECDNYNSSHSNITTENSFINKIQKSEKISPVKNKPVLEQDPIVIPTKRNTSFVSFQTNNTINDDNLLENFITNNKHLTKVTALCQYDITEEDDLYMVQCPKNINIDCLSGLNILQKDKKKFKIGSLSYECIASPNINKDRVSVLLTPNEQDSDYKINIFDVSGTFVIREKLKNNNDVEVIEEQQSVVPFPSKLKVRHPLLGAAYKPLLKILPSVKEKLKMTSNKSPKQKKQRIDVVYDETIERKKAKRKRHKEEVEESSPPLKKIKKENDQWMSEISIEKSLFDVTINNSKKKKNSL